MSDESSTKTVAASEESTGQPFIGFSLARNADHDYAGREVSCDFHALYHFEVKDDAQECAWQPYFIGNLYGPISGLRGFDSCRPASRHGNWLWSECEGGLLPLQHLQQDQHA